MAGAGTALGAVGAVAGPTNATRYAFAEPVSATAASADVLVVLSLRGGFDGLSAMAELERAAPGSSLRTGWLDRLLGVSPATSVFRGTQLGGVGLLGSLAGPSPELVVSAIDDFRLHSAWNAAEQRRWTATLTAMHRGAPATVAGAARSARGAMATTAGLTAAGYRPADGATYPDTDLGAALRDVARLIKAQVGLRIACVDHGDWDFHAGMGTVDSGRFTGKLVELAGSLAALATDLGPQRMAGITVVTLSEFGRRVAENGSPRCSPG